MVSVLLGLFLSWIGFSQALKLKKGEYANIAEKTGGRISVNNDVNMLVKIDAGWYSFSYGKSGTMAFRSFGVYNPNVAILEVTSCFCPGNYFSVYDNGQPILITSIQTVKKTANDVPICDPRITDPNLCASDVNFSRGSVLLLPGRHNLTIVANESPYGGGTAFLRVDSACIVPNGTPETSEPSPCCQALGTCSTRIVV